MSRTFALTAGLIAIAPVLLSGPAAAESEETCLPPLNQVCASVWVDVLVARDGDCGINQPAGAECYRINWGGAGSTLAGPGRVTVTLQERWHGNNYSPFGPRTCEIGLDGGPCDAPGFGYNRWLEQGQFCLMVSAVTAASIGTAVAKVWVVCP